MYKKLDKPKRVVSWRIDDEVYRELKLIAAKELINPGKLVTEALKFWMKEKYKKLGLIEGLSTQNIPLHAIVESIERKERKEKQKKRGDYYGNKKER